MIKIRGKLLGAVMCGSLLGFLPTTGTSAEQPSAAERSDCMGDALSLCSNAIPSVPRVAACLASKKSQVSARCRAHLAKHGL
jgi:hypothetical protein